MPHRDFDRARKAREPVAFRMCGRDYELPGDPPAGVVLDVVSSAGPDGEVTFAQAMRLLVGLIGQERVDQMCEDGMSFPDLAKLLDWIADIYELSDGSSGNGRRVRKPKPSSSTGPSSKPTSNASTAAIHST